MNIIFCLSDSCFDYAMSYLKSRKADLHNPVKGDVPDAKTFAICTGRKKVETEILSLNQAFFGGDPNKPEFRARIKAFKHQSEDADEKIVREGHRRISTETASS